MKDERPVHQSQRAIFLDRDGTIIEDVGYISRPEDIQFIPRALDGLRTLRAQGFLLFVVSNQAGLAKGKFTGEEFKKVHWQLCQLLMEERVEIAEFAYCFHHPEDECHCRKPRPGLVTRTFGGVPIDLQKSFVVGDRETDLGLAASVGAEGLLVLSGEGKQSLERLSAVGNPVKSFRDLVEVARYTSSLFETKAIPGRVNLL